MPAIITDNFGLIIVVVASVIALARKIMEAAAERAASTSDQQSASDSPQRPPRLPRTPPPLANQPRRQDAPAPPLWEPAATTTSVTTATHPDISAELTRQRSLEERMRHTAAAKTARPARMSPLAPNLPSATPVRNPAAKRLLIRRLSDPQEVRRAFILKEILDRPIALRTRS